MAFMQGSGEIGLYNICDFFGVSRNTGLEDLRRGAGIVPDTPDNQDIPGVGDGDIGVFDFYFASDRLIFGNFFFTRAEFEVQFYTDDIEYYGTGSLSYLWDFDDGSTSTVEEPQHTFSNYQTYHVSLTVTDGTQTRILERWVTIEEPILEAGFNYSVDGREVTFTRDNVYTGSKNLSYIWTFGDGDFSNIPDVVHTYPNLTETYDVILQVTDGDISDDITRQVDIVRDDGNVQILGGDAHIEDTDTIVMSLMVEDDGTLGYVSTKTVSQGTASGESGTSGTWNDEAPFPSGVDGSPFEVQFTNQGTNGSPSVSGTFGSWMDLGTSKSVTIQGSGYCSISVYTQIREKADHNNSSASSLTISFD